MRLAVAGLCTLALATSAAAQRSLSPADTALVGRILLAEDRRDLNSPALRDGAASADPHVRMLATRAEARIRDPKFAARTAFPNTVAPPTYYDPAWRLRYRALAPKKADCPALKAALADSAWAVRLRAADLVAPECGPDSSIVGTLVSWASNPPANSARKLGGVSWQPAAHAIVALARIAPAAAKARLPRLVENPIPWLRTYAARAAATLGDTTTLRRLARDPNANVEEAAVDGLAVAAVHAADQEYIDDLSSPGYQVVRAAARALKGSPRPNDALVALFAAARRLKRDSSETSRDARMAVLVRIGEFATPADVPEISALTKDFDCDIAQAAVAIVTRLSPGNPITPTCSPLPIALPSDAVGLALGRIVRLRVTLADSSGGGSFTIRLRGDVAPLMAARILALARSGYYNGLVWQRVEPDFVLQGGGLGANEYVGNPRFMRDELGTVPHVRGTVGMSTRGHDTGDGQWFVNLRDNLRLNADYTVFGEVVDGIYIVDDVQEGDVIARIDVLGS